MIQKTCDILSTEIIGHDISKICDVSMPAIVIGLRDTRLGGARRIVLAVSSKGPCFNLAETAESNIRNVLMPVSIEQSTTVSGTHGPLSNTLGDPISPATFQRIATEVCFGAGVCDGTEQSLGTGCTAYGTFTTSSLTIMPTATTSTQGHLNLDVVVTRTRMEVVLTVQPML